MTLRYTQSIIYHTLKFDRHFTKACSHRNDVISYDHEFVFHVRATSLPSDLNDCSRSQTFVFCRLWIEENKKKTVNKWCAAVGLRSVSNRLPDTHLFNLFPFIIVCWYKLLDLFLRQRQKQPCFTFCSAIKTCWHPCMCHLFMARSWGTAFV